VDQIYGPIFAVYGQTMYRLCHIAMEILLFSAPFSALRNLVKFCNKFAKSQS